MLQAIKLSRLAAVMLTLLVISVTIVVSGQPSTAYARAHGNGHDHNNSGNGRNRRKSRNGGSQPEAPNSPSDNSPSTSQPQDLTLDQLNTYCQGLNLGFTGASQDSATSPFPWDCTSNVDNSSTGADLNAACQQAIGDPNATATPNGNTVGGEETGYNCVPSSSGQSQKDINRFDLDAYCQNTQGLDHSQSDSNSPSGQDCVDASGNNSQPIDLNAFCQQFTGNSGATETSGGNGDTGDQCVFQSSPVAEAPNIPTPSGAFTHLTRGDLDQYCKNQGLRAKPDARSQYRWDCTGNGISTGIDFNTVCQQEVFTSDPQAYATPDGSKDTHYECVSPESGT